MDDNEDSGEPGHGYSPIEGVDAADIAATLLALTFGSPPWDALLKRAKQFATDYKLSSPEDLATALVNAFQDAKASRGELVEIERDGNIIRMPRVVYGFTSDLVDCIEELQTYLVKLPSLVSLDKKETLNQALADYLSELHEYTTIKRGLDKRGRENKPPMEAQAFTLSLVRAWPDLSSERPIAYLDPATRKPKGDFWRFLLEACAFMNLTPPSIQAVSGWMRQATIQNQGH